MPALTFQFRPLLLSGMILLDKETDGVLILIDSEQSEEQQTITLWHEIIHHLEIAAGKSSGEEAVEALAVKLAKACPEVLQLCKPVPIPS